MYNIYERRFRKKLDFGIGHRLDMLGRTSPSAGMAIIPIAAIFLYHSLAFTISNEMGLPNINWQTMHFEAELPRIAENSQSIPPESKAPPIEQNTALVAYQPELPEFTPKPKKISRAELLVQELRSRIAEDVLTAAAVTEQTALAARRLINERIVTEDMIKGMIREAFERSSLAKERARVDQVHQVGEKQSSEGVSQPTKKGVVDLPIVASAKDSPFNGFKSGSNPSNEERGPSLEVQPTPGAIRDEPPPGVMRRPSVLQARRRPRYWKNDDIYNEWLFNFHGCQYYFDY